MEISLLLKQIRSNWLTLLQVHLVFTLLGFVLLTPLFGLLLKGLLALSGNTAVTDQDIAFLLLSPLGMASAIFLIGLLMAIVGLELGALLAVAMAANHATWVTPLEATLYAFRHTAQLLWLTIGLTLRVLAYVLPVALIVAAIAWYLLTDFDINYYLSVQPPEFIVAAALTGALLLMLVWRLGRRLLRWSLVLPLNLFGNGSQRDAFRESEQLTDGRAKEIFRAFVLWLVVSFLFTLVPAIFLNTAGYWIVQCQYEDLIPLVFLIGGLMLGWMALNFLASALTLSSFAFIVARLYERMGPPLSDLRVRNELHEEGGRKLRLAPRYILLCAVAVAVLAGLLGRWLLQDVQVEDNTLVVAHRGAAGAAPENTLASVRRAIEGGADWVEIDVQESRDGQVVVIHDSDFMKLSGNPLKVWEGDLAEIQDIDVGSWFGAEFADQRVPTLQQVLEEIRGRSKLVIELKYYGHDDDLEQRVVDIVEAAGMADDIVVMSLKLEGVRKIQALRPDWTAGLLAATAIGDLTKVDVDFLAVNAGMAGTGFIKRAHNAGKKVLVWTINDALSMSTWMSRGVDGVITDEPALAREVLADRAELSSAERLMIRAALFFGKPPVAGNYRDNSP